MTTQEKIQWLMEHAHSISISGGDHRNCHARSLAEYLTNVHDEDFDDEPEVRAECIKRDVLIVVQCYPRNTVGFYRGVHYDLAHAVDQIFEACKREIDAG